MRLPAISTSVKSTQDSMLGHLPVTLFLSTFGILWKFACVVDRFIRRSARNLFNSCGSSSNSSPVLKVPFKRLSIRLISITSPLALHVMPYQWSQQGFVMLV